jgi:DNA-binding transcriptional regulator GbsR (MarR family)
MQHTAQQNITQIVYNYLLENNNENCGRIAFETKLSGKQVTGALNNLQKRKLVVANKEKDTTYYNYCAIVITHTAKFRKKRTVKATAKAIAIVAKTQQKQSITQYAKTMFTAMLNKFKHYA